MAMMRRLVFLVVLVFALLTSVHAADDEWKGFVPPLAFNELVKRASARLDSQLKLLEGGKLEDDDDKERAVSRARGAALLMAAYAQSLDAKDLKPSAALRDTLLQLDKAVRDGKLEEARSRYKLLDRVKAGDNTKPAPRSLHDPKEREDVVKWTMNHYRTRPRGGLGVEPPPKDKTIDGLEAVLYLLSARPKDVPEFTSAELMNISYQTAVLAQLTRSLAPEKKEGDKDPAKWRQWSEEMRNAALEMAQAAQDKKPDAMRKAARKINASCSACHKAFRDS